MEHDRDLSETGIIVALRSQLSPPFGMRPQEIVSRRGRAFGGDGGHRVQQGPGDRRAFEVEAQELDLPVDQRAITRAASWLAAPLAFLVCVHQTLYVWRQMRRSRRAETGEAAAQEAVAAATRNATLLAFLVAALTIYLAASGAYG